MSKACLEEGTSLGDTSQETQHGDICTVLKRPFFCPALPLPNPALRSPPSPSLLFRRLLFRRQARLLDLIAELRLLLKNHNTDHHHHLWQPRALALNTPFPLAPPPPLRPPPSCLTFPLPVSLSLSLGCLRRSRVVCGGTVKPVRLSSLEDLG